MLRLVGLRKSFGGSGAAVVAVDGLSLEVRAGEVFGLLGPNGAGKSTTISMAVGVLEPDDGEVEVVGVGRPTEARVRRAIGLAPQALAIYGDLTARENLVYFGRLFGLSGTTLRARADELLEWVGLSDRAGDRAEGFSGGMKRRLNLAASIMHDPPVVMLDEPTAGVDPQSRNKILELVRSLAAGGKAVVYTTHYMEEAEKICDRVGVIERGRVIALGTVEELVRAHGGRSLVTIRRRGEQGEHEERRPTDDPVSELQRALAGGSAVVAVSVTRPDLETVFLNLTGRSLRD